MRLRFALAALILGGGLDLCCAQALQPIPKLEARVTDLTGTLTAAQQALSLPDVVNQIEVKLDDLNRAPEVARAIERIAGRKYATTTWMERNHQLLNALQMEKAVTVVTIGLIELVAALNILITLVMMVMEKYRDIAVLMSMGARRRQIRLLAAGLVLARHRSPSVTARQATAEGAARSASPASRGTSLPHRALPRGARPAPARSARACSPSSADRECAHC